jgi:hypothetical protein
MTEIESHLSGYFLKERLFSYLGAGVRQVRSGRPVETNVETESGDDQ